MHPLRYENTYLNLLDDYTLDLIYETILKRYKKNHKRKFRRVMGQFRKIVNKPNKSYIDYLLDIALQKKGLQRNTLYNSYCKFTKLSSGIRITILIISFVDNSNKTHYFKFIDSLRGSPFSGNHKSFVILCEKKILNMLNRGIMQFDEFYETYGYEEDDIHDTYLGAYLGL